MDNWLYKLFLQEKNYQINLQIMFMVIIVEIKALISELNGNFRFRLRDTKYHLLKLVSDEFLLKTILFGQWTFLEISQNLLLFFAVT